MNRSEAANEISRSGPGRGAQDAAGLDWIARLVRAVGQADSLDGLLTALAEEVLTGLNAESGLPGVRTGDGVTCQFMVGPGGVEVFHHTWLRGEGVPGWVLAHKRAYVSNEAAQDPQVQPEIRERFNVRSVLCVPILERGGEAIGFFAIFNKRDPAGFTVRDLELATSAALIAGLAVQAELALRAARGAERATRSYAESIRLLRDIAIASNTAATPQDALQAGIDRICDYCQWPVGHALLCDPDDPDRLFSSSVWHFDSGEPYDRLRLGVREGGTPGPGSLAVRVLKTRQALWLPLAEGEPGFEGSLDTVGALKAAYALPVWSGPDVVAVLEFYSAEDQQANLARLDMLTQICSLLGHVIVRSRTLGQLEIARDRLRQLSAGLMESHESERRRIALELHDEIGQSLTVIKLHLEAIKATPAESERHKDHVGQCLQVTDAAIQQVRVLTLELRPGKLDDLGLSAAIRWLLDQQARVGELSPIFNEEYLPERLPPNVETACYRIAQEALNNVIRHGKAKRVWVNIALHDNVLHLSVRDNGIGFDAQEIRQRRTRTGSLGLIGMEERATLVGGALRVTSRPGLGTKVHATIPIDLGAVARKG